jgi:uncharacterized membrane protein YfcA
MDFLHIAFLLVAGIAGGVISTLAGGAAVITFPALLATGISPVFATATNMVALVPGNVLAVPTIVRSCRHSGAPSSFWSLHR